ncbi:MAG: phytanoyl-CoA dioxygenase family protein [Candidatus Obscuribacterales bacterium]|nr:phytanoyl-CoA dioxygenase family protein [Candidatus Obscuribacterales bacterium]
MNSFEDSGFVQIKSLVNDDEIELLKQAIAEHHSLPTAPGVRHLLRRSPIIRRLAKSPAVLGIAAKYLGANAVPVKAIYFDKTAAANWYVTWHQDLTIAVKEKIEVAGYGPWSMKDDIPHVQPPTSVLENMLAIRIHLDDCSAENGAINFIAGSHSYGKLNAQEICEWREKHASICCPAERGDAIVMRPLILHSSSKSLNPEHRRVLHIEYACVELAGGLKWNEASGLDSVELVMATEEEEEEEEEEEFGSV